MALVAWTYGPALDSYLITDDFQWLASAMDFSFGRLFDVSHRTHFYRPVVEVYFALMHSVFGCSATALHAASLVLHAANAVLAMWLAYSVTSSVPFAAISATVFAVQPAPAEAVLWPSAASALLSAAFGLTMLLVGYRGGVDRDRPYSAGRALAVTAAFAAALGSHESAVMLPAAAWLLRWGSRERARTLQWVRDHGPVFAVLALYLALTAWINSRNYVITEGRYAPGWHMAGNLSNYLVALWVGRRVALDYAITFVLLGALLWKGSDRVRAWTVWVVAALLPMLPFGGPTASRYAYMAAIPFSWLVTCGILAARRALRDRSPAGRASRVAASASLTIALIGFVVVRSATFARKGTHGFHSDAVPFQTLAEEVRKQEGPAVSVDPSAIAGMEFQYVLPLARVAKCDGGVTLARPAGSR